MSSFDEIENNAYRPAAPLHYTLLDRLKLSGNFLVSLSCIIAVLGFDLLVTLSKLFWCPKLKNISGQLALVTGKLNKSQK